MLLFIVVALASGKEDPMRVVLIHENEHGEKEMSSSPLTKPEVTEMLVKRLGREFDKTLLSILENLNYSTPRNYHIVAAISVARDEQVKATILEREISFWLCRGEEFDRMTSIPLADVRRQYERDAGTQALLAFWLLSQMRLGLERILLKKAPPIAEVIDLKEIKRRLAHSTKGGKPLQK